MTERDFLNKMKDILDYEDELSMDDNLADIEEWDSLGVITFLAEMNKYASVQIKADSVKNAKTISELYKLLK